MTGTEQLDETTETLVYRAAQEAVRNIVRHADRLQVLTGALHNVEDGVILFDGELKLEFINDKARKLWSIPEGAERMPLPEVLAHTHLVFDAPPDQIATARARRLVCRLSR